MAADDNNNPFLLLLKKYEEYQQFIIDFKKLFFDKLIHFDIYQCNISHCDGSDCFNDHFLEDHKYQTHLPKYYIAFKYQEWFDRYYYSSCLITGQTCDEKKTEIHNLIFISMIKNALKSLDSIILKKSELNEKISFFNVSLSCHNHEDDVIISFAFYIK